MLFLERQPGPLLAPFVASLWYFEGQFAHRRERVLPNGAMQVLINLHADELRWYDGPALDHVHRLRGAALGGVRDHAIGIDTSDQRAIAGIAFRPGGAAPFFDPPAHELADRHVELDALWGSAAPRLRERLQEAPAAHAKLALLEEALLARARGARGIDPCIAFALDALEGGASIARISERIGYSEKHFGRRFVAEVGLAPKRFARLRRFRRLIRAIEDRRAIGWAALAQACGYHDQAHMIRDFREFAGVTPSAYAPRSDAPSHLIVE